MTTRTATKVQTHKVINVLDRTEIKANGVILYTLLSSNNVDKYFITIKNGKIDASTHQDCLGFANCYHCYHIEQIESIEEARETVKQDEADEVSEQKMDEMARYYEAEEAARQTARCYREMQYDPRFA
jgi:hypothetical protein